MLAVIQREMILGLRRGTPYLLLCINGLLLAGLALAVSAISGSVSPWVAPSIGSTAAPVPNGIIPTLVAWRGAALFFLLALWLAILTTFLAPAIGARTIGGERRSGALATIIASGQPPMRTVAAKLIAGALQIGMVLFSGLPAFALAWLFGGVSPRVALLAAGLLAAYALLLVAIGMLFSAAIAGDLLPAATGGLVGTLLLLAAPIGVVVGTVVGQAAAVAPLAAISPLTALLTANPELTDALVRASGSALQLPTRPGLTVAGQAMSAPLPGVTILGYGLVVLLLIPLIAAILDPYHPVKTLRLRRATRSAGAR